MYDIITSMVSLFTQIQSAQKVTVDVEAAGQRLDNFLMTYLKGIPKTHIYKIVRKGEVRVNKGRIAPDYRLRVGDSLRIPPIRMGRSPTQISVPIAYADLLQAILYEDEDLLILNKPTGIAVHGGSGISFGVIEALRAYHPRGQKLELVHRLDKETSGCLMIAKRRSMLLTLHEMLKTSQIEKQYLALVEGQWPEHSKTVVAPLIKNQLASGERIVRVEQGGQFALTEFRILRRFGEATLVEAHPITGRTHQIRVHALHEGHPIAMDMKYGSNIFNQNIKKLGLMRLFFFFFKLTLNFSDQRGPLIVEAPLDHQLEWILNKLVVEHNNV